MQAMASDERILKDPEPMVALAELADSSVNFVVRPWVKGADYWDVKFDLTEHIKLAFDEKGISIPFPQMDVHMDLGGLINPRAAFQPGDAFGQEESEQQVGQCDIGIGLKVIEMPGGRIRWPRAEYPKWPAPRPGWYPSTYPVSGCRLRERWCASPAAG